MVAPISKKMGVIPERWGHWPLGPRLFLSRYGPRNMTIVLILLTVFLFWLALNAYNVVLKFKIYKKNVYVIFGMQKWDHIFWHKIVPSLAMIFVTAMAK